jgi:hypothetical protein
VSPLVSFLRTLQWSPTSWASSCSFFSVCLFGHTGVCTWGFEIAGRCPTTFWVTLQPFFAWIISETRSGFAQAGLDYNPPPRSWDDRCIPLRQASKQKNNSLWESLLLNKSDILMLDFAVLGFAVLMLAWKAPCHLSHSTSPVLCFFFFFQERVTWTICWVLASNHDPPDLCLLNS